MELCMYENLFQDVIFKELDFIDALKYKDKIDLNMVDSSIPQVWGNTVRSSILEGKKRVEAPRWVDYANGSNPNLMMLANYHLLEPEICQDLVGQINENMKLKLLPKYVLLVKTLSTSYKHIDTIFRRGAINCFIQNANFAVTNFYDTLEDDGNIIASLSAEDGKSYLLNGAIPHQVVQDDNLGVRLFLSVTIPLDHLA